MFLIYKIKENRTFVQKEEEVCKNSLVFDITYYVQDIILRIFYLVFIFFQQRIANIERFLITLQ